MSAIPKFTVFSLQSQSFWHVLIKFHCGLNLHISQMNEVGYLSPCLFFHSYVFFSKTSIQISPTSSVGLFDLLLLNFECSLYILGTHRLSSMRFANIFFLPVACPLIFLMMSSQEQKSSFSDSKLFSLPMAPFQQPNASYLCWSVGVSGKKVNPPYVGPS